MIHGRKPIMSAALENHLLNAVVMFNKAQVWKKWGLHHIRKQGSAILLYGPPGCGKTVIAEWLSLRIRKCGIKEISFADFGSPDPGENSRTIRQLFADAEKNGGMTIYLNECDAIILDRDCLGADAQWMLEIINELLVQIENYKYLVILSTNRPHALDKALARRLLLQIEVPPPEFNERVKLWHNKMPDQHPLHLKSNEIKQIATLQLTGAEIENVILNYSSDCIRRDVTPNFKGLFTVAKETFEQKQINEKI